MLSRAYIYIEYEKLRQIHFQITPEIVTFVSPLRVPFITYPAIIKVAQTTQNIVQNKELEFPLNNINVLLGPKSGTNKNLDRRTRRTSKVFQFAFSHF